MPRRLLPAASRAIGLLLVAALGLGVARTGAEPLPASPAVELAHEDALALIEEASPVEEAPEAARLCDGGSTSLEAAVSAVARQISGQRIVYGKAPLSDCSGIFHRTIEALGARCAGLITPPPSVARSSAAIAQWYDRRGLLVHVSRPEDADPFLVPGALLFFAHARKAAGSTPLDRVMHVGVVVDVTRDERGQVLGYSLFHGRQPGTVAGVTRWHARDTRPPLGNGPDALVGIGFMEPTAAEDGIAAAFDEASFGEDADWDG